MLTMFYEHFHNSNIVLNHELYTILYSKSMIREYDLKYIVITSYPTLAQLRWVGYYWCNFNLQNFF